jgi:tetratricopeptide (TPR) repeat protein
LDTDELSRLCSALAGRYRISREIGRGGYARVYLAEDLKHRRSVAIKVLNAELSARVDADRFLREIEVAAGLTHPNIVPVLDSGRVPGFLFYVMPYVAGESLRSRLERERQLPIPDAVQVVLEVADALNYAHARGVVHRDIKPGNILLEEGHAVVCDFGVARALRESGNTELTEPGAAVGTALYMSPEQASGERNIDGRSDIYSLGCVLYELLAGEPPYTGPTPMAVIARKLTEPVRSVRVVRENVSETLEEATRKALARLPADRFASGAEFNDALKRGPTEVQNEGFWPYRRQRRFSVRAAFASVVLILLVSGLYEVARSIRRRPVLTTSAPVFFQGVVNKTQDQQLDVLTTQMETALRQSAHFRLMDRSEVGAVMTGMLIKGNDPVEVDEKIAREIAWRGGAPLFIRASVLQNQDGFDLFVQVEDVGSRPTSPPRSWTNTFESADKASLPEAVDAAGVWVRTILGEEREDAKRSLPVRNATTSSWEALEAYSNAMTNRAAGQWSEAVANFERAVRIDPEFALAYGKLGDLHNFFDMGKAIPYWRRALALSEELRLSHSERFDIETVLAYDSGDLRKALESFKVWSESYPHEYKPRFGLAMSLSALGRDAEAIAVYREMAEQWPDNPMTLVRLAEAYLSIQRWDSAGIVLDRLERVQSSEPRYRAALAAYSGRRAFMQGNHGESIALYTKLLDSGFSYWESTGYSHLASVTAEMGDFSAALAYLERGMNYDQSRLAANDPMRPHLFTMKLLAAAHLHYRQQQNDKCVQLSRRVVSITSDPRRLMRAGTLLARCGKANEALKAIERLPPALDLPVFKTARYRIRGEAYVAKRAFDRALAEFEKAAEIEAPTAEREYIARALELGGDVRAALGFYRAIVQHPGWSFRDDYGALALPGFLADAKRKVTELEARQQNLVARL